MYCKRCGTQLLEGAVTCPQCGQQMVIPENTSSPADQPTVREEKPNESSEASGAQKLSVWCWLAITSLACGCFTFYKGIDKMIHYNAGDRYPYEPVNAYVGGDAYNYIINSNYAASFFVLTAMFVLAAVGLLIVHYLAKVKEDK